VAPPSIIVASSSSSRRSRINFGVDEIIVHPLERNQDQSLRSSQLQQPQAQSEVLTSCLKSSKMRKAKGIVKKLLIEQSEASSIIIKGNEKDKINEEQEVPSKYVNHPKIQTNEYRSLAEDSRTRRTSYGTIRSGYKRFEDSENDTSGDNDSCWSASDQNSSSSDSSSITSKMSRRQILVFIVVLMNSIASALAVSLFPPFFPQLAEMKGSAASEYGSIIGTSCLVAFLVTPWIGNQLPNIGVKFSFCYGTFASGVCIVLSGFLEFFEDGQQFIVFSVLIRIVNSVANALTITSSFAYQAMEFPDSVAKVFSFTRMVMNVTQMVGPAIGGILLQYGGFHFPFVILGGIQIITAFVAILLLPPPQFRDEERDLSQKNKKTKLSVCKIMSIPTIWFSFAAFIIATMCNGFLSVNMEPAILRQFNLSPFYVGLIYGLKDGANSITSPLWGYFCDNNKKSVKPYLIASSLLAAFSFALMGAGDVLGIVMNMTVTTIIIALCVNGAGIGGQQLVGVVDALHEVSGAGYPDTPATKGLVAGMWSSLSGAGRFTSRAGSGLLVHYYGFTPVSALACGLQCVVALATFLYLVMFECSLVTRSASVRWEDVTIVERGRRRDDKVVFTNSSSPSESLMTHAVSIGVPSRTRIMSSRIANSMPPNRRFLLGSFSEQEMSRSMR